MHVGEVVPIRSCGGSIRLDWEEIYIKKKFIFILKFGFIYIYIY